jgi:hypothetical protein
MKKLHVLAYIAMYSVSSSIFANMGPAGFYDFPNYYFVETGTLGGDGVARAQKTNLFKEIYSMDIHLPFIEYTKTRFPSDSHIHIIHGDSSCDLKNLIQPFDRPITFWLDAHHGTANTNGEKNTPLMQELEQIKSHPIKTHTILIDDMHCVGGILFDYLTKDQIIQKILEINPAYNISYVTGGDDGEYPDNIMVAQVKSEDPDLYLKDRLPLENGRYSTFIESLNLLFERNVRTIVETGTARCGDTNFDGDGGSTIIFSHWAKEHGAKMFSVDISQPHIDLAKAASSSYLENIEFVLEDSVKFLKEFPGQIDFLYLDSYDYDEENPNPPQEHALKEIMAAYDKLTDHSIIMIDDCNIPGGGKGKLAIDYLINLGWYLRTNGHQVILLKQS